MEFVESHRTFLGPTCVAASKELTLIIKECELLYHVPTKAEPWIKLKPDEGQEGQVPIGAIDEVTVKVDCVLCIALLVGALRLFILSSPPPCLQWGS